MNARGSLNHTFCRPLERHLKGPDIFRLTPWIAFFCALAAYWSTVEPGASLWDCPEYLDGALRLEIGHPPGNPTWLLAHRFFSLFGFSLPASILAVNLAAGLFTAWAVGLLCACSQRVLRLLRPGDEKSVALCSLLGSLCFGWADSPWFSAVEAEVYAMSLWMTALCVWLSLKWYSEPTSGKRWQILILISYILGLSVGVHQLTMLVIPAIALIICYRRFHDRSASGSQWLYLIAGCAVVAVILLGLMKVVPRILASTEILAVNHLGFPYHTGTIAGWAIILVALATAALTTGYLGRRTLSGAVWCLFFCSVGFSSYALIMIRANAAPPMNQGNPSDIFSFITYIDREQYGGAPLLHGSTPYSRPLRMEHVSISENGDTIRSYSGHYRIKESPRYSKIFPGGKIADATHLLSDGEKALNDSLRLSGHDAYLKTGYKSRPAMIPELEMWLPRIHSAGPEKVASYGDWTGMSDSTMAVIPITEAADSTGKAVPILGAEGKPRHATGLRPTYLQNLTFFLSYQCGYMYFRYLLWNFCGRQNDVHSGGEVEHGNFITGITPLDNLMLGAEDALPPEAGAGNPGRNRYFMIPFLLGVAGLIWLCSAGRGGRRTAAVYAVLFLMTGLAIVVYLNQSPGEPRERDYSFLGSFWVFGFWISAGMLWILTRIRSSRIGRNRAVRIGIRLILALVPLWMLYQNYDDHDRSGRYPADEYAGLVLGSLPEGTILFTSGDNHTFPLWYARGVRGTRRDITVVNTNYLQLPWEVLRIMSADEKGQKVQMTMKPGDVAYGGVSAVRLGHSVEPMVATEALRIVYSDTAAVPVLPTSRLLILGREPVVFDVSERFGVHPGGILNLKQIAMLDIVATNALLENPRPVAWHHSLAGRAYEGWENLTTPLPFALLWNPLGVGDETQSREAILKTEPVGKPGNRYIDPVYGGLISYQRIALMTDARRAIESGDTVMAVRLLDYTRRRFPFSEWAPQLKGFRGETIDEALLFAELAERAGRHGAKLHQELADSLKGYSDRRRKDWRRYREALPPRLRPAMTPTSRRLATRPDGE